MQMARGYYLRKRKRNWLKRGKNCPETFPATLDKIGYKTQFKMMETGGPSIYHKDIKIHFDSPAIGVVHFVRNHVLDKCPILQTYEYLKNQTTEDLFRSVRIKLAVWSLFTKDKSLLTVIRHWLNFTPSTLPVWPKTSAPKDRQIDYLSTEMVIKGSRRKLSLEEKTTLYHRRQWSEKVWWRVVDNRLVMVKQNYSLSRLQTRKLENSGGSLGSEKLQLADFYRPKGLVSSFRVGHVDMKTYPLERTRWILRSSWDAFWSINSPVLVTPVSSTHNTETSSTGFAGSLVRG